ncbi:MAG TPA: hypothetical protein VLG10_09095 [Methylomirabilota bacterium]|nr:hypothetical protein [Methylomirabilota bacterium]
MQRQGQGTEIDRRRMLMVGFGGASVLLAAQRESAWAQRLEEKGKVERKESKPIDSMVPGFQKVRVREVTYQPGASSKAKMQNAMICECTQGVLEVMQDDKKFTAKKGDMWTCRVGMVEGNANNGTGPATMRVIDLLTS